MRMPFLLILALGTACVFGAKVESFRPANSPNGAIATLQTASTRVDAELLDVRDSGLVVLNNRTVTFVPYRAIDAGRFKQVGVSLSGRRSPNATQQAELQLVSRFPQGLTRDMERKLLDAYHQASIALLDR